MRADTSTLPLSPDRRPAFTSAPPAPQQELLLIEPEVTAVDHAAVLRRDYRVATTADRLVALEHLNRTTSLALVVADFDSHGDDGVEICQLAQSLPTPATVLLMTSQTAPVPDLITAGCDAVLLKPLPANLLYARIGRLMRMRSEELLLRARNGDGTSPFVASEKPLASTNRTWPATPCPECDHHGAVSFEFSSYRRSWYACLACKNVWIAKRQE